MSVDNPIIKNINHLGLFSGMMDELGIVDTLDELIPLATDDRTNTSVGQRVKAILLFGMGFSQRALYSTPLFLESLPLDCLFAKGFKPDDFNQHALGRALDKISEYGTTKLFSHIAFTALQKHGLLSQHNHLDSSSISLLGKYAEADEDYPLPTFGYSKDHRPDLKQVVVNMIANGPAGVPIWFQTEDGNQSDKVAFHDIINDFTAQIADSENFIWIADSALYSKDKLKELSVRWLTRVPSTLKQAKHYCQHEEYDWKPLCEGYQGVWVTGIDKQKWVLVESEQGKTRDLASLERKLLREEDKLEQEFKKFGKKRFACAQDATAEIELWQKKLKWHDIRVAVDWDAKKSGCQLVLSHKRNTNNIKPEHVKCGRFILATNDTALTMEYMLNSYKEQSTVERGFRFLKDQQFRLDHVLLKKNNRIDALLMIMALALLLYNLSQYLIRERLKSENKTFINASKKPIQNPTLMWVIFMMQGINILYNNEELVATCGIRDSVKTVLCLLGEKVMKAYNLA